MKKTFLYIISILAVAATFGCEESLDLYDNPDNRLNFYFKSNADTVVNFTFVYEPATKLVDTLWVTVNTMGFLSDKDREVSIEQVQTSGTNAIAGKHYVPFDDASIKGKFIIPAGKNTADLPIVVKRDASLKNEPVNLLLRIADNENFKMGYSKYSVKKITISDQLTKPSSWGGAMDYYLGEYGPVKHQFMIDVLGRKVDNEYLYELGFASASAYSDTFDIDYIFYMKDWFNNKLVERNAERAAQDLDPLAEADGTLVSF